MSSPLKSITNVIPARLAFLAIYNPSLGKTDETVGDQIVYHYSRRRARQKQRKSSEAEAAQKKNEDNETIRQIGLAQGMVEFAKTFSNGESVDSVETEKSRIILHELESGWWIYAAIDLTRLTAESPPDSKGDPKQPVIEYSTREVSPPALLLQQLLQAHSIFLLHHGRHLEHIYARLGRTRFCSILDQFWTKFARTWDVLLHGNPAVDILGGIKLAGAGELGIGVGEEQWGSGEREVLEGLVQRTEGLVDLMVSRFGHDERGENDLAGSPKKRLQDSKAAATPTRGQDSDADPLPTDGVVFSGVGAISRASTRSIASWMHWLHRYDLQAYGAQENPKSTTRRKPRTRHTDSDADVMDSPKGGNIKSKEGSVRMKAPPGLRAQGLGDVYSANAQGHGTGAAALSEQPKPPSDPGGKSAASGGIETKGPPSPAEESSTESTSGSSKLLKYMTFGYASSWGVGSQEAESKESPSSSKDGHDRMRGSQGKDEKESDRRSVKSKSTTASVRSGTTSNGYFLIGLQGNLDEEVGTDDEAGNSTAESGAESERESSSGRLMLRTITVELAKRESEKDTDHDDETQPDGPTDPERDQKSKNDDFQTMRVVVYKHAPFVYTLLFDLQSPSLAIPAFYRSLHHSLKPLQRPLLQSTSPERAHERLESSDAPSIIRNGKSPSSQPIYDLVYDPQNLTIVSSIPNIPEPSSSTGAGIDSAHTSPTPKSPSRHRSSPWTRIEALNVHTQILNIFGSTRHPAGTNPTDLEQSCKTSRAWWIVWMRLPAFLSSHDPAESHDGQAQRIPAAGTEPGTPHREAFIIRKSSVLKPTAASSSAGGGGTTLRSVSSSFAASLMRGGGLTSGRFSSGFTGGGGGSSSSTGSPAPSTTGAAGTASTSTATGASVGAAAGSGTGNGSGDAATSGPSSSQGPPPDLLEGIGTDVGGSTGIGVDPRRYIQELMKLYQ